MWLLVCEPHPFLGATPDGTVYDLSNAQKPVWVSWEEMLLLPEALNPPHPQGLWDLVSQPNSSVTLQLCRNHCYYSQVQGQMAVGERPWCNFVGYTNRGISVERVEFDKNYWQHTLLPKLEAFFDNCLGPEIISPFHEAFQFVIYQSNLCHLVFVKFFEEWINIYHLCTCKWSNIIITDIII